MLCDAAALGAVMDTKAPDRKLARLTDVQCQDDWAIATAQYKAKEDVIVEAIEVFQYTPDGWVHQDREGSCSAMVIPESLSAIACTSP